MAYLARVKSWNNKNGDIFSANVLTRTLPLSGHLDFRDSLVTSLVLSPCAFHPSSPQRVAWISSGYFESLLLPQLLRGENDSKQSDVFQATQRAENVKSIVHFPCNSVFEIKLNAFSIIRCLVSLWQKLLSSFPNIFWKQLMSQVTNLIV